MRTGGRVAGIKHRPGLLSWLMIWVWMSLDVAKQQAKLGTTTAKQSCQLPGKASFMVAHTRRKRSVCTRTKNTHTHIKYIDTYAHTVAGLCRKHTHLLTHTNAHTHVNCQERCLEREDPCHLLSRPASLLWLPNCQSPLSTTSHTEKQMSACHFSEASDFKMVPLFFQSISEGRERERPSPACLSLWHSSPPALLTAPCTFG